jgi:hypothetical protein
MMTSGGNVVTERDVYVSTGRSFLEGSVSKSVLLYTTYSLFVANSMCAGEGERGRGPEEHRVSIHSNTAII